MDELKLNVEFLWDMMSMSDSQEASLKICVLMLAKEAVFCPNDPDEFHALFMFFNSQYVRICPQLAC